MKTINTIKTNNGKQYRVKELTLNNHLNYFTIEVFNNDTKVYRYIFDAMNESDLKTKLKTLTFL